MLKIFLKLGLEKESTKASEQISEYEIRKNSIYNKIGKGPRLDLGPRVYVALSVFTNIFYYGSLVN